MTMIKKIALTTAASVGLIGFGASAQAATVFSSDIVADQSTTPPSDAEVTGTAALALNEGIDGDYGLEISVLFSDGIDFSAIIGDGPGQIGTVYGEADFDEDDVDATRFHIHNAPRGETGQVVFGMFDIVAPGAVSDLDGDLRLTFNEDGTTTLDAFWDLSEGANGVTLQPYIDQLLATMVDEDTALYFNLHTVDAPAGLIRGQIVGGADVVPLPAAAALFVPALAAGGFLRRRKLAA